MVNPLVTACACTGSMRWIHLECLREWLDGKKHMRETACVNSYIWKNLECEVCKQPYTDIIKSHRNNLLKYRVHEDAHSYMVIESVTSTTSRTIHVVNFSNRGKVRVGRGVGAEVRITDISVSRFHTHIKLNKHGHVVLSDNQSKFGTLVQLGSEPLSVKQGVPLYVQVGRAVLVLFAVNRHNWVQRMCGCLFKKQVETCLHFDELPANTFPIEFTRLFDKYAPKKNVLSELLELKSKEVVSQLETPHTRRDDNEWSRDQGSNLRREERQPSVAIGFITSEQARLDSEVYRNNLGGQGREEVRNDVVLEAESV